MEAITEINSYVGYKIEIHPTEEQKSIFNRYFGTARYVYNLGIDIQKEYYEKNKRYLRFYSLNKEFIKLKHTKEYSWLTGFDATSLKLVLQDVCNAYDLHKKNRKHYGKPRYKSKKKSKFQFPIRSDTMSIRNNNQVYVPSIGFVDSNNSYGYQINGFGDRDITIGRYIKFVNPRISKKGSRYYLSFSIPKDEDHNISSYENYGGNQYWQEQKSSKAIGIDVGLKHDKWLKDSTGRTIKRPKCEKEYKRLKFYQQKLNRQYEINKVRDPRTFKDRQPLKDGISKNMQKIIDKINKLYDRITNKRRNVVHEYCKELLQNKPDAVVMEDIKVNDLMIKTENKNCNFQKEHINNLILDAALFDTAKIIENTMVNNGIKIIYADKQYPSSQICNNCGHIHKIGQAKYYRCPECGMIMDRDFNAAINLSKLAYLKCPVKKLDDGEK